MKRKIIQISVCNDKLTALCDDGTIWRYIGDGEWVQISTSNLEVALATR